MITWILFLYMNAGMLPLATSFILHHVKGSSLQCFAFYSILGLAIPLMISIEPITENNLYLLLHNQGRVPLT